MIISGLHYLLISSYQFTFSSCWEILKIIKGNGAQFLTRLHLFPRMHMLSVSSGACPPNWHNLLLKGGIILVTLLFPFLVIISFIVCNVGLWDRRIESLYILLIKLLL
jgi:hypothetical protein